MASFQEEDLIQEEDTQKGKYLTFSLGDEFYGIEIKHVTEIIGIQYISEIPELPEYVRGVINLRGNIIPIMDVRLRFKKIQRSYDERTCIVVINMKDISVGLIVDMVLEVLSINDDYITEPPRLSQNNKNKFIKGIGKVGNEVKFLLNCEELLGTEDNESK